MLIRNLSRLVLLLAIVLSLSSCAAIDTYEAGIVQKVKDTNDRVLRDTMFYDCEIMPMGTWQRNFDTPEKAAAWANWCKIRKGFNYVPLTPEIIVPENMK